MKYLCIAFVLLMLQACVSEPTVTEEPSAASVPLSPEVTLTLPAEPGFSAPIDATQLIIGKYALQRYAFNVHVKADAHHLDLVGLDSNGARDIGIAWSPTSIVYDEASWIPSQLRPAYILADMIVIYWPLDKLRNLLDGPVKVSEEGNTRTLMSGDTVIADVDYGEPLTDDPWQAHIHYRNFARGYSLDIQSARTTP